jgi:pentatricopeptide repeat protein
VIVLNALLSACDKAGAWRGALFALQSMGLQLPRELMDPTTGTASEAPSKPGGASTNERALMAAVAELSARGRMPEPNARSVNSAVRAVGRGLGSSEGLCAALSLVQVAVAHQNANSRVRLVDTVTCNTILSLLADGGHWRAAARVLWQMRGRSPKAKAAVAVSLAVGEDPPGADLNQQLGRLLDEGEVLFSRLTPCAVSYNNVIRACAVNGAWRVALSVLGEMLTLREGRDPWLRTISVDNYSFGAAIGACERGGEWAAAAALYRSMKPQHGLTPNVACLNGAVKACAVAGRMGEAQALMIEARDRLEAQDASSNTTSRSSAPQGPSSGPATATLNLLLLGCGPHAPATVVPPKEGQKVTTMTRGAYARELVAWAEEQFQGAVAADAVTLGTVVRASTWDEALAALEEMVDR